MLSRALESRQVVLTVTGHYRPVKEFVKDTACTPCHAHLTPLSQCLQRTGGLQSWKCIPVAAVVCQRACSPTMVGVQQRLYLQMAFELERKL